ncbi:MAG: hypothetical protein IBX44_00925 [Sulfurospirillum sp.]|nr:hypothetical protein [Sulfurospirillum sp.]
MKNYVLFDKLSTPALNFTETAKLLLTKLQINFTLNDGFKKDLGLAVKAYNDLKFHTNNAFNLTLASKNAQDIICVDESSYLSLCLTKQELTADNKLKALVEKELAMPVNLDTKVMYITEILHDIVGLKQLKSLVKSSFGEFYCTVFRGSSDARLAQFMQRDICDTLVSLIDAKNVKIQSAYGSDGFEIYSIAQSVAYNLSGVFLLDAFDHGADFILVNDINSFFMFDVNQKAIEKVVGRDIALPILNLSQVILLALGEKEQLQFDKHKAKVTLL